MKIKKESKIINYIKKRFILEDNKNIKYLIIIMLLSTLTGLLTPIGKTPYTYFYLTAIGNSQTYILEHASNPLLKSPFVLTILLETFILVLMSKIKLRDLFMICGIAFMSIQSFRHLSLFVLIGGACFIRLFITCLKEINFDLDEKAEKIVSKKIAFILILITAIIISGILLYNKKDDKYIDTEVYPTEAVKYIKENLDVEKIHLYNEYNFGSYLILKDIPVFIDSRADLYTKQFNGLDYDIFDDYSFILTNHEEKFDFYEITHLLIYKNSQLKKILDINDNYKKLYEDKYFVIYERLYNEE